MLGSGNVAGHLAIGLDHIADVIQVYSPNIQHASSLADKLKKAQAVDNTDEIVTDADFYIIAVKDDAISSLAAKVTANGGIWAHTSGSVPMSVFEGVKDRYGVFYPLQTFNRHDSIDFSTLPMLIEGGDEETETALFNLASMISKDVHRATSGDRAVFHRAAVFACNFANYMWCMADDILHTRGFDLTLFRPLLTKTLENALNSTPYNAQTGPARRGDKKVMDKHLSLLTPDQAEVYSLMSRLIYERFNRPLSDEPNK